MLGSVWPWEANGRGGYAKWKRLGVFKLIMAFHFWQVIDLLRVVVSTASWPSDHASPKIAEHECTDTA